MNVLKKYLIPVILLIIVVIAWLGITLISKKQFVPINPNASSYTKPLKPSFNEEILNKVDERTGKSFPVLPHVFLDLKTED